MKVYVPCYTHCSDCGLYSGQEMLGVAFLCRESAEQYLKGHPNKSKRWGDGQMIVELEISSGDIDPDA